jgi:hypothetical protein
VQKCHADEGEFSVAIDEAFEQQPQPLQKFFTQRIRLYAQAWADPKALRQAQAAIEALSQVYRKLYDAIFEQQLASDEGFEALQEYTKARIAKMAADVTCVQSATDLAVMYQHALTVLPHYKDFCASVATATGGVFQDAPVKTIFRTIEKSAMRHNQARRFHTDGVMDLVRGALVYETFDGLLEGVKALCDSDEFKVLRIKDRFAAPTDAGWRDVVVNGVLIKKDRKSKHKVEVQLHYEPLVAVRESLGGHFIYAKQRALVEALEVVFGRVGNGGGGGGGGSDGGGGGGGGAAAAAPAPSNQEQVAAKRPAQAPNSASAMVRE